MPGSVSDTPLVLEVLQQFRLIFGSMRQYFRLVEERCGMPGSHLWVLQEVQRQPGLGIGELARRMGIHQSTCSLIVEKLVSSGRVEKGRGEDDRRRVGLLLTESGAQVLARLPGPAEGILPEALSAIPEVALKTLNINLSELIHTLSGSDERFRQMPLAEMVRSVEQSGRAR